MVGGCEEDGEGSKSLRELSLSLTPNLLRSLIHSIYLQAPFAWFDVHVDGDAVFFVFVVDKIQGTCLTQCHIPGCSHAMHPLCAASVGLVTHLVFAEHEEVCAH